jgi:choline kinase
MASLWFAKEHLCKSDDVVVINGDIVVEERLVKDVICAAPQRPNVLIDSSIKSNGDYNVQVCDGKIVVMSKELDDYHGEYAGITRFDAITAKVFATSLVDAVNRGQYDQWYENILVQMIFQENFSLYYTDISEYNWTEIDSVSDLVQAKRIVSSENPLTP